MERKFKNTNGRPPKLEHKLAKSITIALTDSEYLDIVKKAKSLNLKPAVYARNMVLKGKIVDLFSDEEKVEKRKLIGMSNNINQLAFKANIGGFASIEKELVSLMFVVDELLNKYNS